MLRSSMAAIRMDGRQPSATRRLQRSLAACSTQLCGKASRMPVGQKPVQRSTTAGRTAENR